MSPADIQKEGAPEPVIRLRNISKEFPGVLAVDEVDLDILPGEVHVVAGENGAGKSTLMKLLSQVERPSGGGIEISGEEVAFHGPRHAQSLGVAMVYQEFALAPDLSVAENLFMGREPGRFGFLNRRAETSEAGKLLERVGLDLSPTRLVAGLTVAEQQRVEIAKALAIEAKVMILDEPTATLTEREIDELFGVIRSLTDEGIAVLYISHRLDEIFRIADRVTVMRDGKVVDTVPAGELDENKLVRMMVGREIDEPLPQTRGGDKGRRPACHRHKPGQRAEGLLVRDASRGDPGLRRTGRRGTHGAGAGGVRRRPHRVRQVELDGERSPSAHRRQAIEAGIGYLTEDRKGEGLALQLGVDKNITLARFAD